MTKQWALKVDMNDSYIDVSMIAQTYFEANSSAPYGSSSQTVYVRGTKGAVEGQRRTDQIEISLMLPDGTVVKQPTVTKQVRLDINIENLSPDEILSRVIDGTI